MYIASKNETMYASENFIKEGHYSVTSICKLCIVHMMGTAMDSMMPRIMWTSAICSSKLTITSEPKSAGVSLWGSSAAVAVDDTRQCGGHDDDGWVGAVDCAE
jgi:hypothetical protein